MFIGKLQLPTLPIFLTHNAAVFQYHVNVILSVQVCPKASGPSDKSKFK